MIDLYKNLPTLDLHGENREISTVLINDFIEDNYKMKNKKVIIIHGLGTKILLKNTQEVLKKNKYVESYKIDNFNEFIYNNIYSNNITFAKFYNIYKTYFGNLFPIKELDDTLVFNESISYIKEEEYLDGVKLTVDDNYLIPSINDGIVIFIGDKDNYHNTIIIQDLNGIEIWYSNINIGNIGIYDYVKKGDYLGEAISNEIYLRFQKNGVREDYKKYI